MTVLSPAGPPDRRRRLILAAVVAVTAAATLVAVLLDRPPPAPAVAPPPVAGPAGLPPWPAPIDPTPGEREAGLIVNPLEGAVNHFHVHLDILVDNQPVTVPANLGIDTRQQLLAELHTHADSGVIHAEAVSHTTVFTLGQLFTEWGVELDRQNLGGLRAGNGRQLWAYVNGHEIRTDPGRIELADHQEIVLAFGSTAPKDVPATFDFAATPV